MKTIFLTLLGLAVLSASSQAALVLSDTFSYSNGAIVIASAPKWKTYSGTANQLDVAAGRAHFSSSESEDVEAVLTPSFSPGGTLYFSFILNLSTLPSTSAGSYVAALKDVGTIAAPNFRARVFVTRNGAGSGKYRVGVANVATRYTFGDPTLTEMPTES